MADKEISAIAAGTKPDGTELVHVKQGANSRRLTTRQFAEIGAEVLTDASTTVAPAVTDVGNYVRFTAATAVTVTFNTGIFSAGDEIMFEQAGAGTVTYAAGAGFTLRSSGTLLSSNGQYSVQGVKFISATEAVLMGDRA